MSKIIDFAEVKRARDSARLKGALLAMPEGMRAVFMAATQHHAIFAHKPIELEQQNHSRNL